MIFLRNVVCPRCLVYFLQTSFSPNFLNKTTAAAINFLSNITSLSGLFFYEVMRFAYVASLATEVVFVRKKLG
jgi:hypothetical protein